MEHMAGLHVAQHYTATEERSGRTEQTLDVFRWSIRKENALDDT